MDKYKSEFSLPDSGSEGTTPKYTTKHGTVSTMRTENIGRRSAPVEPGGLLRELERRQGGSLAL